MNFRLSIFKCQGIADIREKISIVLQDYIDLFPRSKDAKIVLKPNLNSNMNALTGNTTDLRILSSVIEFLKRSGYNNIVIAEGTNSGFYRNNINVISRLKVDSLAKKYGVSVIDLNYAPATSIEFENGVKAEVAKICLEADFLINLPKIKMHFEAGMTACMKNLMGCLVGQKNKKKTHDSLAKNILNLNKSIKPDLHIVDGLIAMEGTGPSRGTPVNMGLILVGTDPFLLDLACAKLIGLKPSEVPYLKLAEEAGYINVCALDSSKHQLIEADMSTRHKAEKYHEYINSLALEPFAKILERPKVGLLASFIHHPKRQKYFLKIRNSPLFNYLCSTKFFGNLLVATNLRQDVFTQEEEICHKIWVRDEKCSLRSPTTSSYGSLRSPTTQAIGTNCRVRWPHPDDNEAQIRTDEHKAHKNCRKCAEYCPMNLQLPEEIDNQEAGCIHCLYCFFVCPNKAIEFEGSLGFLVDIDDEIVRVVT